MPCKSEKKYLEKKYRKEVLGGADYIDSRQRSHYKKWLRGLK